MQKLIPVILGLLCCLQVLPQFTRETQPARHYYFTHFTTSSGLSSYQINTILQDHDGYIWIATNDGLQRYDGVRYKTFRHRDNDSSSLPSNLIWQILSDKNDNLWVLTIDGKAGIFNTKTFLFSPVTLHLKNESFYYSSAPFKRFIKDEFENTFLMVPGSEVLVYNQRSHSFDTTNDFPALQQKIKITDLIQQPGTHKYWLCTDSLGLAVYDQVSGQLSYASHNVANEEAIEEFSDTKKIKVVFFDRTGRLWTSNILGETPSVSCYDPHKRELIIDKYHFDTERIGYHEIRTFFEQKDGSIWVYGQRVFAKFLEKEKQFEQVYNGYEAEHGIDYITITRLMEDKEHDIWTTTANNGIFRYNPSRDLFSNISYISHTTKQKGDGGPTSFMPDKDGSLLVGIREDGLYRFDKNMKQLPLGIKGIPDKNNIAVWGMCTSSKTNIIWMAAAEGVYKYDQQKKTVIYYHPPVFKNKTVKRIIEDKTGRLWIGTQEAGVFKWDPIKGREKFESGLAEFTGITKGRVNKITTDRKGYIWIGTNSDGAYMIDPVNDSICLHFHNKAEHEMALPQQSVLSILDYNDSIVIIGNNTQLVAYNRLQKNSYLLGNRLSGFIASIQKDDAGHLWVSTTTSLYRVTVSNKVFLLFNRSDGLENDYFLLDGSCTLPDKKMLFGVYGAIIAFLPSAINSAPTVPDLKITGFTVKDKSLRVDSLLANKQIVLAPDENSMVIDLSVMSYNSNYLLKYKMDDLDKTWKNVDHGYQLVYSYLPPGIYTLNVKTIDQDGVTGAKTIHQTIKIKAPFWQTWWFYSVLLLLFLLFLFWLDRQRTNRREAIQNMRSNIAGNLHREVNITLNNINILSEMAKLKADTNPEKSKEFIGQINVKSEHMIIAMDDMLWSIDPANDSMQKTVERLREFIDTLNSRHDAGIEILVDEKVERLKLDMQLRHEMLLIFKDTINTEVQYGARNIRIHINFERSCLVYSTQFGPATCNIKQLNNFLYSKDTERRLAAIKAKLSMDQNKSSLLVSLKLPVA